MFIHLSSALELLITHLLLISGDVTPRVEYLGNPWHDIYSTEQQRYARNVWDLQAYKGKLYIGGGNSSNTGPARNAGPVPVIAFDPKDGNFSTVFTVDDEQIDRFFVFGDDLYIPGHDATQSWDWGNLYRLTQGAWTKYRNIPNALHVYDLHHFNQTLFAGLGSKSQTPPIAGTHTDDLNWSGYDANVKRIYAFLEVDNHLYATSYVFIITAQSDADLNAQSESIPIVFEYHTETDRFTARQDLRLGALFPDRNTSQSVVGKIVKPVAWRNGSAYIGALVHNDHQFMPQAVYFASSLEKNSLDVKKLALPEGAYPWDILLFRDQLYILLQEQRDDATTIKVLCTDDFTSTYEVLRFTAPTFARSFEVLNGDFYFGLGSEVQNPNAWSLDELKPSTGEILRVDKAYVNPCPK